MAIHRVGQAADAGRHLLSSAIPAFLYAEVQHEIAINLEMADERRISRYRYTRFHARYLPEPNWFAEWAICAIAVRALLNGYFPSACSQPCRYIATLCINVLRGQQQRLRCPMAWISSVGRDMFPYKCEMVTMMDHSARVTGYHPAIPVAEIELTEIAWVVSSYAIFCATNQCRGLWSISPATNSITVHHHTGLGLSMVTPSRQEKTLHVRRGRFSGELRGLPVSHRMCWWSVKSLWKCRPFKWQDVQTPKWPSLCTGIRSKMLTLNGHPRCPTRYPQKVWPSTACGSAGISVG